MQLFSCSEHVGNYIGDKKIDKSLSQPKKPQLESKNFMSKVPIWVYIYLTEQAYKSFSGEEKTGLLNKYYLDLHQKCYASGNFFCYFLLGLVICCLNFPFVHDSNHVIKAFFKYILGCANGPAGATRILYRII